MSALGPNATSEEILRLTGDLDIRNHPSEITGVLIVSRSGLLQALEGPPQAVDGILAQLDLSHCHGGWHILSCEATLHRKFGRWHMTIAEEPAAATVAGLIDGTIRPRRVIESLQLQSAQIDGPPGRR